MRVLIVEDTLDLSDTIMRYLIKEGYSCVQAYSYSKAQEALIDGSFDMVVLDIMLPDGNGLDLLFLIKQEHPKTGILIVSAKNALDDKIHGLGRGADDYLTKPFHLSELNARLKAIYRRRHLNGQSLLVCNEIQINPETMEVLIAEESLILTRKEYELLVYFLSNQNRVLTKQSIAEHLWGDQMDLYDSFDFVYQHIKNLRKKITKAGGNDYIATQYGFGYKFNSRKS
ncbi:MAG: response regulator transcription factor [Bacteroidota bacterium]